MKKVKSRKVKPPQAHDPIPSKAQLAYYKEELAAFIHFGMNTFTGKEWGDGSESPELFNPSNLDARQWVDVLHKTGFKRIIFVAKHHDGFALWPSKYTEHSVKNSPWRDGNGDVLLEISQAASLYDMEMGVYLSPWDAHEPSYGNSRPGDYNVFYMNQLHEILSDPRYGNNGKFVEVWMDGAKGSGEEDQLYHFEKWFELIKSYHNDTLIFSPYGTEIRWIGNENGEAGETCWQKVDNSYLRYLYDHNLGEDVKYLNEGQEDGPDWSVGEADVSIRNGWFYHDDQEPKNVHELLDIYFKSVGRGVPLLLNVPVDKRGLIAEKDQEVLFEFREALDAIFSNNLIKNTSIKASNTRGKMKEYAASNVKNDDYDSYWTVDDSVYEASLLIEFEKACLFDVVAIQEYIPLGQRISKFNIEVLKDEEWETVYEGSTIGYKKLVRLKPQKTSKLRFNILASQAIPLINHFGIYKLPLIYEVSHFDTVEKIELDKFEMNEACYLAPRGDKNVIVMQEGGLIKTEFVGSQLYLEVQKKESNEDLEIWIDGVRQKQVPVFKMQGSETSLFYEINGLSKQRHQLILSLPKSRLQHSSVSIFDVFYHFETVRTIWDIHTSENPVYQGETIDFIVRRFGHLDAETVLFETKPASAVHGKSYQDKTIKLEFSEGERSKQVSVQTIVNPTIKARRKFLVEISSSNKNSHYKNKKILVCVDPNKIS